MWNKSKSIQKWMVRLNIVSWFAEKVYANGCIFEIYILEMPNKIPCRTLSSIFFHSTLWKQGIEDQNGSCALPVPCTHPFSDKFLDIQRIYYGSPSGASGNHEKLGVKEMFPVPWAGKCLSRLEWASDQRTAPTMSQSFVKLVDTPQAVRIWNRLKRFWYHVYQTEHMIWDSQWQIQNFPAEGRQP